jgi:hypothetical protein
MTIQGGFLIIDRLVLARLGDDSEIKTDRFQDTFLEIILRAYCEHKRNPVQVPKECAASSDAELGARLASCVLNFLHIKRHWVAKHSNLSLAKNAESKQCFDHVELGLCSAILKGPVTTRARAVDALWTSRAAYNMERRGAAAPGHSRGGARGAHSTGRKQSTTATPTPAAPPRPRW